MNLLGELKRRNVFRVAMLYVVAAWLVIEVAETVLPIFEVPDGVLRGLVVLLVIGIVPALGFAWIYELTPEGLKRDTGVTEDATFSATTGHRLNWATLVVAALAISFMAYDRFAPREPVTGQGAETVEVNGPSDIAGSDEPVAPPVSRPAHDSRPLVAVLPFANLSTDTEQEFFADGITEDILTRLAGVSGLRVISRTSVMRYKNSDLSLPEIAAELGVSHVLEGSVRRAGDRVRITGQLIRASDDTHLWADSFDRELADIFSVQTEIAQRIAQQLELELTERDQQVLARQGTTSAAAYEYVLRARALEQRPVRTPTEVAVAIDEGERYLRAALELDPDYAEAWALMTRVEMYRSWIGTDEGAAREHWARGIEAARRAIELAPDRAVGYVALGQAFVWRGQDDAALEQFRLAAELEPGSAEVLQGLGNLLAGRGELLEGLEKLEQAVALEPGDPNLWDNLARTYSLLGDFDSARAGFRRAWGELVPHEERLECMLVRLEVAQGNLAQAEAAVSGYESLVTHPSFGTGCLIDLHLMNRNFAAARQLIDEHRSFVLDLWPLTGAIGLHLAGEPADEFIEAAERNIDRAVPRPSEGGRLSSRARIAMVRGEDDVALELLGKALETAYLPNSFEFVLSPLWDRVRDDPRFQVLEARWEGELARMRAELAARRAEGN